jgi:hypothetical protein
MPDDIEGPSGSQTEPNPPRARRASMDDEEDNETVVTTDFQRTSIERANFLQRQNNDDKEFDPDDVESRMPAEKSSLKSSLKVEDTILRLNIGGSSYRIRTRSILKYGPTTLLGRLCRMDHEHRRQWADAYFEETDEFFFERVPRLVYFLTCYLNKTMRAFTRYSIFS